MPAGAHRRTRRGNFCWRRAPDASRQAMGVLGTIARLRRHRYAAATMMNILPYPAGDSLAERRFENARRRMLQAIDRTIELIDRTVAQAQQITAAYPIPDVDEVFEVAAA